MVEAPVKFLMKSTTDKQSPTPTPPTHPPPPPPPPPPTPTTTPPPPTPTTPPPHPPYLPWRTQHENTPNTHVSAYCRQSLRSTLTYINMKTVRLYIETAINLQRKCLGTPDCKNMENMLIDFIWLNVQAKYLIQTILYHFKWDMALWKWPKCPQYIQRNWWQTVATQHTGLT